MFDFSALTDCTTDISNEMRSTLTMLDSYSEAGLVIAPHEATETMVEAAGKLFDISENQLRRIYQVMIDSQD